MTVNADRNPLEIQIKRGYMALEDHDWTSANSLFEEALNIDYESSEAYVGKLLARDKEPNLASWVAMQKDKYKHASQETIYACDEDIDHIVKMVHANVLDGYLDARQIRKELDFDRSYLSELSFRKEQRDLQLKELAQDRLLYRARQYGKGDFGKRVDDGISQIKAILDQRVSNAEAEDNANIERIKEEYAKHLEEADQRVMELNQDAHKRQEEDYQNASALLNNAKDASDFQKAIEALNAMNGYKDSAELAEKASQLKAIDEDYSKASGMMESNNIAELNNAISILSKNQDWKDSKERSQACTNKVVSLKRAQEKQKRIKIAIGVAIAIVAIFLMVTQFVIPNQKYNEAIVLMENKKYAEAIKAFEEISGFKDSSAKIEDCNNEIFKTYMNDKEIGSTISFGDIDWLILDKEENRVLVITEKSIGDRPYNTEYTSVTWETCSLRNWLNLSFYNETFSEFEKSKILTTILPPAKNPEYDTNPGNFTNDKIFLLSIQEAEYYFSSNEARDIDHFWWLRSPGDENDEAADVDSDGSIRYQGSGVIYDKDAVRPAMWISIK